MVIYDSAFIVHMCMHIIMHEVTHGHIAELHFQITKVSNRASSLAVKETPLTTLNNLF